MSLFFVDLSRMDDDDRPESPPSEILNDRSPTYFAEPEDWSNGVPKVTSSKSGNEKKRIEEEELLSVQSPEDDEVSINTAEAA